MQDVITSCEIFPFAHIQLRLLPLLRFRYPESVPEPSALMLPPPRLIFVFNLVLVNGCPLIWGTEITFSFKTLSLMTDVKTITIVLFSLEPSPVLGESHWCIRLPGGAGWSMRPSTELAISVATHPGLSLP